MYDIYYFFNFEFLIFVYYFWFFLFHWMIYLYFSAMITRCVEIPSSSIHLGGEVPAVQPGWVMGESRPPVVGDIVEMGVNIIGEYHIEH